jgi:hypothetical protein
LVDVGDPTRVAAGPLGTNVVAAGGDTSAYGLKMKAMMLGSASDRFRIANKGIANLVAKMGLPDEVKSTAQVSPSMASACQVSEASCNSISSLTPPLCRSCMHYTRSTVRRSRT